MKIVFGGHTAPLASRQTHSICVSFIKWLRTLYDPHFAYLSLAICSCSSVLGNAGKREKSQSTKMSRARFEMRQAHSIPFFFHLKFQQYPGLYYRINYTMPPNQSFSNKIVEFNLCGFIV